MSDKIVWQEPDAEGGTFSRSNGNHSPHGYIPYSIENRHDGVSLGVNLLIRGLKTTECAREIAQEIEDVIRKHESCKGETP